MKDLQIIKKPARRNKIYLAAAFTILILVACVYMFWGSPKILNFGNKNSASISKDESGNAMVKSVKDDASRWTKNEKNMATLFADMRTKNLAGVVMSQDRIFATTKDEKNYVVNDDYKINGGKIFFSEYVADTTNTFPVYMGSANIESVESNNSILGTAGRWLGSVFSFILFMGVILAVISFCLYLHNRFFRYSVVDTIPDIRFSDVIGMKEAKAAMQDVMDFYQNSERYESVGAKPIQGILMYGQPGVGKTQLAKAVAGESNMAFIAVTGSEFTSKYFGAGVDKVKALFATARRNAPCILFIDEIDGVGSRGDKGGIEEAEGNRIINQILTEMDGFHENSGVMVIGATNSLKSLDPALIREGRFDRKIHVPLPSMVDREELFKLYTKNCKLSDNVDFKKLARLSTGLSPAAIASTANYAAILVAKRDLGCVNTDVLLETIEVSQIGETNPHSTKLSASLLHRIAAHEVGHAIIAHILKTGTLEKVSILPRGDALGITFLTNPTDTVLRSKSEIENQIQMMLGGRCAELMLLGEASSGASNDLKQASLMAYQMVATMGMSQSEELFSVEALVEMRMEVSNDELISQANQILMRLNARCLEMLEKNRRSVEALTNLLIEKETIDGNDFIQYFDHSKLPEAA
jgi:cell division protease FtsH